MKIVASHPLAEEAAAIIKKAGAEFIIANSSDPMTYMDELKTADIWILRIGVCTNEMIDMLPNLKVIGLLGVGHDNVDCSYCAEKGIPVVVTPGANQRSVAEHTLAMILAFSNDLKKQDAGIREGHWEVRNTHRSFEVLGKTIGILGLGAIGKEICRLTQALGMKVIGYDPFMSREKIEALGAEYCEDYRELLKVCDFVTIHVPLMDSTKDMITMKELKTMKPSAFLINCARGGIANEADLAEALKQGVIAGAGIDSYTCEPVNMDNPLFSAPNTILTPHAAAMKGEAFVNMSVFSINGCLDLLAGKEIPNVVEKSVYKNRRK